MKLPGAGASTVLSTPLHTPHLPPSEQLSRGKQTQEVVQTQANLEARPNPVSHTPRPPKLQAWAPEVQKGLLPGTSLPGLHSAPTTRKGCPPPTQLSQAAKAGP